MLVDGISELSEEEEEEARVEVTEVKGVRERWWWHELVSSFEGTSGGLELVVSSFGSDVEVEEGEEILDVDDEEGSSAQ